MDKAPQNPTSATCEPADTHRDYWALKRRLALQAGREGGLLRVGDQ